MSHHPLCYSNEGDTEECDPCFIIRYVTLSITPECTCEYGGYIHWEKHEFRCKFAAFAYSQDRTVWE